MKNLLLLIFSCILLLSQAQSSSRKEKLIRQYSKIVTMDIRIEPVGFFTFKEVSTVPPVFGFSGKKYVVSNQHANFGGLHVGFGVAIKKQFHIDAIAGFERKGDVNHVTTIPAGVDVHINILKSRVSPFIHFGCGYLAWDTELHTLSGGPIIYNGAFAAAGFGCSVRINQFLAIAISPDYRFIYFNTPLNTVDSFGWMGPTVTVKNYVHQIGLHVAIIFY